MYQNNIMATSKSDEAIVFETSNALKAGNQAKASTGSPSITSTIPYIDSAGLLQYGAMPVAITQSLATSVSVLDVTSATTLSADLAMQGTLVAGSGVTTWTKTGFLQINVTDSAGNITNGKHYIQFGTLT